MISRLSIVLPLALFCHLTMPHHWARHEAAADELIVSDASGIKDPPDIKRIAGAVLLEGDHKAFDEFTAALQRIEFDYDTQQSKPWNKLKVEGARWTAFYRLPKDATTLEPSRSYEEDLTSQGFELLFKGSGDELDDGYGRFVQQVYGKGSTHHLMQYVFPAAKDFRYIALRRNNDDGSQTLFTGLFARTAEGWASKYSGIGDVLARVDLVKTKVLTKRLVLVKAEEMAQEMVAQGKVALYGIQFDFNMADIKPESSETLQEVAKYLTANQSTKVIVAGHTDNVGDFEFNRSLSDRRAKAVVEYLVSKHQISRERLFPFGASFASPVSSNSTEEGKAKNRRVELVPF